MQERKKERDRKREKRRNKEHRQLFITAFISSSRRVVFWRKLKTQVDYWENRQKKKAERGRTGKKRKQRGKTPVKETFKRAT